jgi:hypothetical protein
MSASSSAPSASTKSMSPDRGALGKLIGHLYMAARILLDGRACTMDEMRQGVRILIADTGAETTADTSDESDAASVLDWNNKIGRQFLIIRKLPDSVGSVPDNFKKDLARLIKQGKRLCSSSSRGSDGAQGQIKKATQIYRTLSGASYL